MAASSHLITCENWRHAKLATIHHYRELPRAGAGEMLIVNADMDRVVGHVQRGERSALADYFARLIGRLARGGAEVAAISAVTPHICIRELEKISALPLVNIVDETAAEIRARGYQRVTLFGARYTVESRVFGMLDGVEVVAPDQTDAIHEATCRPSREERKAGLRYRRSRTNCRWMRLCWPEQIWR